jgi:hypothetical protein
MKPLTEKWLYRCYWCTKKMDDFNNADEGASFSKAENPPFCPLANCSGATRAPNAKQAQARNAGFTYLWIESILIHSRGTVKSISVINYFRIVISPLLIVELAFCTYIPSPRIPFECELMLLMYFVSAAGYPLM